MTIYEKFIFELLAYNKKNIIIMKKNNNSKIGI